MKGKLVVAAALVLTAAVSSGATYALFSWNQNSRRSNVIDRVDSNAFAPIENVYKSEDGWISTTVSDSMTGRPQEEFMSPMTTLVGPGNITGNIRVRCMHHASSANKRLEAYINFSSFFSSRDNFWSWSKDGTMIKSRIRGVATSDGLTSFIELDSVRAFLDALSSNGEIRIKVSVYDGPEIVFRPFMKGGAEFIAKAKSDCGV